MKLNYLSIFTLFFIFFLAMNFIAAEEIGENCTDDALEIYSDTQDSISFDSNQYYVSNSNNEDIDDSNEVLSSGNSINHVYVSHNGTGDGVSYESPSSFKNALDSLQDNTIVHMADGNYTITSGSYPILLQNKNNITIVANDAGKVMLNTTASSGSIFFKISASSNIAFKDITFQGGSEKEAFNIVSSTNGVFFENCTFSNYNGQNDLFGIGNSKNISLNYCNIINCSMKNQIIEVYGNNVFSDVLINNCVVKNLNKTNNALFKITRGNIIIKKSEFINNTGTQLFSTGSKSDTILNISSCVFRDNKCDIALITTATLIFENNTVDSEYAVELTGGCIVSPTLTVLNNTKVTVGYGETVDITFVLTDDKGNIIKVPKITFKLDNNPCTATYDAGVYHYSYTAPQEAGEIYIENIESSCLKNPNILYKNPLLTVKPSLNMSADDISDSVYGDNITVKVNISNSESGNLTYEFVNTNGFTKNVTEEFENNISTVSLNDLPAGDYTLTVKYVEDDDFAASTITKTFTVNKANSTIENINVDPVIPVGNNITVLALVPSTYTGNITYRLNTENKTVNVTDKAVFDGLTNGTYTVYAKYNGDDNYNPSEEFNVTFRVVKLDPVLNITHSTPVVINETVTITVNMNDDITEIVDVIVNGAAAESKQVNNGILEFPIVPGFGNYNITVSFKGNEKYNEKSNSTLFTVSKLDADLNISAASVSYGTPLVVNVTTNTKFTGDIIVYAGKYNQTAHIINGVGNTTFNDLPKGDYAINATFTETPIFNGDYKNTTAAVSGFDTPLVITYSTPVIGENVTVKVTMKEDINDNVTVSINNVPETKVVKSGVLEFNVLAKAGDYNITVSFKGSDKYNEASNNTFFSVSKLDADLNISAASVSYGTPLVVNVTTNTKFTGDIIVYAGKYNQTAHIINGVGNATFADLPADTYVITANFTETPIFNGDVKNTTATVKGKEVPADKAISINVPANTKSPTFSINLDKDATGTFTVSVDGKVVGTKELKDGAASITVNDLAAGDHKISVSYSGDGKYAPITQNTTLNIKEPVKPVTKKNTKIVAKKKTFKAKTKVKKYTITLKSGKTLLKKVKVTLKVKGKTYTAKTNKKGKAVFKIKNLKKKGKYTATIKFKGNKNYKPATKKVKITVKK